MNNLFSAVGLALGMALASVGHAAIKGVVLAHGAFVDGSGWSPVAAILEHDGFTVFVVQEPETTFGADVAATRLVLDRSGPCVLVGHRESAGALNSKMPPASNSITPVGSRFLQVNSESFPEDFAADVPKPLAHFMAISQVPISVKAFGPRAPRRLGQASPVTRLLPRRIG